MVRWRIVKCMEEIPWWVVPCFRDRRSEETLVRRSIVAYKSYLVVKCGRNVQYVTLSWM
jgi:hypothetical protein